MRNKQSFKKLWNKILLHKYTYLMLGPAVVWVLIFCYAPMIGLYMAFVNFKPKLGDFWHNLFTSDFVGMQWLKYFFAGNDFAIVMRNTLVSSTLTLILGFIAPVTIAILLNEVKNIRFKKVVQTASYLPYFVSWVIAANIITTLLSSSGAINQILVWLKLVKEPVLFLQEGKYFWIIIALANTWKDMGYNSIIYLSAITSINPSLFEAAKVDGANRWQQIRYVLLPGIKPTVVVMLILSVGNLLNTGFDQFFLLGNSTTRAFSDVIDTYAYRYGIQNVMFSYASAVSLFKSVVAFILVFIVNKIAKKTENSYLF